MHFINIYLRNYAMTSLPHCHVVVLPLTVISIKLLKYRSKGARKAKIEQKLLNMKREDTLHMRLVNLSVFVVCHYIYVTKNIQ